jgi:GNAT superfamily N-acetyltransferase
MRAAATLILAKYLGQTMTPRVLAAMLADFPASGQPIDLAQLQPRTCGRLTFAAERFAHIREELEPLHAQHLSETEGYHRGIPLRPAYAAILVDELDGRLLQLTARDGGRLVGNLRLYLSVSRHTSQRIATEDTIYLLPEYRGGRNAQRFIQFAEDCLRALDVSEVYLDTKHSNQAASRLLGFMGYEEIATRRHKILREDGHVRT